MNEGEAIAALTDIGEAASTFTGLWVSVTFAYLTVAYLVGGSLSRFQCFTVSALYIVSTTVFGLSAQGYVESWRLLHDRVNTVFNDVYVFEKVSFYGEGAAIFLLGGTLVSLYFMYDVRLRQGDSSQ